MSTPPALSQILHLAVLGKKSPQAGGTEERGNWPRVRSEGGMHLFFREGATMAAQVLARK